jgi:hypothetical protein
MNKTKVRDFGTPDSRKDRHRHFDAIMKNNSPSPQGCIEVKVMAAGTLHEKVMSMTDANGVFQDAVDRVDFEERADHD